MSWLILTKLSEINIKLKKEIISLKNLFYILYDIFSSERVFLRWNFGQIHEFVNISYDMGNFKNVFSTKSFYFLLFYLSLKLGFGISFWREEYMKVSKDKKAHLAEKILYINNIIDVFNKIILFFNSIFWKFCRNLPDFSWSKANFWFWYNILNSKTRFVFEKYAPNKKIYCLNRCSGWKA